MLMKCFPFRGQVDGPVEVKKSTIASRSSSDGCRRLQRLLDVGGFFPTLTHTSQVSTMAQLNKLYCIVVEDVT